MVANGTPHCPGHHCATLVNTLAMLAAVCGVTMCATVLVAVVLIAMLLPKLSSPLFSK